MLTALPHANANSQAYQDNSPFSQQINQLLNKLDNLKKKAESQEAEENKNSQTTTESHSPQQPKQPKTAAHPSGHTPSHTAPAQPQPHPTTSPATSSHAPAHTSQPSSHAPASTAHTTAAPTLSHSSPTAATPQITTTPPALHDSAHGSHSPVQQPPSHTSSTPNTTQPHPVPGSDTPAHHTASAPSPASSHQQPVNDPDEDLGGVSAVPIDPMFEAMGSLAPIIGSTPTPALPAAPSSLHPAGDEPSDPFLSPAEDPLLKGAVPSLPVYSDEEENPTPAPSSGASKALAHEASGSSLPQDRVIRAGDQIALKVPDETDLNLNLRVGTEGLINLPYVGEVKIAGLSVKHATRVLQDELSRFYVNPSVSINIIDSVQQTYVLMGQVERPGVYAFPRGQTSISLMEAIARASGTIHYGDLGKIRIKRKEGNAEKILTYNAKNMRMEEFSDEIKILPGDMVTVQLFRNEFNMLGQIRAPGVYEIPPLQNSIDLMESIAMAGGVSRFGDLGEIVVKRTIGGKERVIRYDAKDAGRNEEGTSFPIYAGDTIIVQLMRNDFVVLGQVNRPGTYSIPPLQDSVDLVEAIAMAGGATRLANLGSIRIRRLIDGKPKLFSADLKKLIASDEPETVTVMPGDQIVVGERIF